MKLETLSFRDKFDILLEKRLSGIAGLRYIMLYGKSQLKEIGQIRDRRIIRCVNGYGNFSLSAPTLQPLLRIPSRWSIAVLHGSGLL